MKRKRYRTWTVFTIALCSLLALTLVPSLITIKRSAKLFTEIRAIQGDYDRNQRVLDALGRNLFVTSLVLREFLLDTSAENDRMYTQRLQTIRSDIQSQIVALRTNIGKQNPATFDRLDRELEKYWTTLLPIFQWSPKERAERGTYFLRQEQRPRRQSILAITDEIGKLIVAAYRHQSERLNESEQQFRTDLRHVMNLALLAGLIVSAASIFRIARLERRGLEQQEQAERTGEEMRNLSMQLRHAQEEERRTISRELHDEVGQTLTALQMELGSLDSVRKMSDSEYTERLSDIKGLATSSLRMIRDIAGGLRPSLLDDLGLGPALQRQVRQFTKHTGLPVSVDISGDLDGLPDRHRTYIYRIVQESLTNCAKHSGAKAVGITLSGDGDEVVMKVKDDGIGFDLSQAIHNGLGLIGIEERVRELGGTVAIHSAPGNGAEIEVVLSSWKGKSNGKHSGNAGG